MDYMAACKLLGSYGIRAQRSRYARDSEDAVRFSAGNRIVIKAMSQKALHKSRSGLVALNVSGEGEIRKRFTMLEKRAAKYRPFKILVQDMVPFSEKNVEIIVGGNEDSQFGKMILLGLGGIYVEAFRDFSLRACPITRHDAESMIDDLRAKDVIAKDKAAREMVTGLLLKVSRMLSGDNGIKELDLNPIILHDGTYSPVDVRVLR